jgi:superfamily II RNA helicase
MSNNRYKKKSSHGSQFGASVGQSHNRNLPPLDINSSIIEYLNKMADFEQNKKHLLGLAAATLYSERNEVLAEIIRPTPFAAYDPNDLAFKTEVMVHSAKTKSMIDQQQRLDMASNKAITTLLDESFMTRGLYVAITSYIIFTRYRERINIPFSGSMKENLE